MSSSEPLPSCPICECSNHWLLPFLDRESGQSATRNHGYAWHLCVRCGSGYPSMVASLEDLQRYWNYNRLESLESHNEHSIWEQRIHYAEYWAKLTWETLGPFMQKSPGRFMDIACGLGVTVKHFQDQGWHAIGIDADPNTGKFHEKLGINSIIGQFEHQNIPGRWDIISIAHAIYFVNNPGDFLAEVRNSLSDHGLFLVIISNFSSPLSDALPSKIHTWYPSPSAMQVALRHHGFEIVHRVKHRGSVFFLSKKSSPSPVIPISRFRLLQMRWQRHVYIFFGRPVLRLSRLYKKALKNIS